MFGTCECCEEVSSCAGYADCYEITDYDNSAFNITFCGGACGTTSDPPWNGLSLVRVSPCQWLYENLAQRLGGAVFGLSGVRAVLTAYQAIMDLRIFDCGTNWEQPVWQGYQVGGWETSAPVSGIYTRGVGCSSVPATLTIAACPP